MRISTDLRPLDVLKRDPRLEPNRSTIDRRATVVPVMCLIIDGFPISARKPEPAVLVFDNKDVPKLSGNPKEIWAKQQFARATRPCVSHTCVNDGTQA